MSMYICIHSAAPKYMHINTCTGVPFRAADSANRRGRFPRGAGRLVVSARDWAHVRARLAAQRTNIVLSEQPVIREYNILCKSWQAVDWERPNVETF